MSNNIVFDLCTQHRRRQLFGQPPIRLELQTSPYLPNATGVSYTKYQLDMRRKAEILKYLPSAQSTQTNNLTKAQQYSQFINNANIRQGYSNGITQAISANDGGCPKRNIPMPSTASDVPGPPIMLYLDDTVPLYNYATNIDAYAVLPTENPPPYLLQTTEYSLYTTTIDLTGILGISQSVFSRPNIQTTYANLYSVNFTQNNDKYITFNVNTPISLYITGTTLGISTQVINIHVKISNVYLTVYYNTTPVSSTDPLITISNTNQLLANSTFNHTFTDISLNISTNTTFSANQYVGMLNINNIQLVGSLGNIYDVQLSFMVNTDISLVSGPNNSLSPNKYLSNLNCNVYSNTQSIDNTAINCTLVSSPSTQPFSPISISGS
jgi:hypothetical protein